jgi:predicted AAA+ superfamily ATPase
MTKLAWTPWHKIVEVRPDVKSGEPSLNIFAADLYDVAMGVAKPVYKDPKEFFSLTYPTFNLRELAKDIVTRLAGKSEKAVRQLELTYGGGKIHSLITIWHLVSDPEKLPDLPAVNEFIQHIGMRPPKSRIAVLPFDKLDAEKGMEVLSPNGEKRWLKNPWSVIAFQIAGGAGLRLLHPDEKEEERDAAPAENLMSSLLSLPRSENLSTLILIDEVLMYAREKVSLDPVWQGRLADFFQSLTQAATKVDRCAIVASLLATDPRKSDALGKAITADLYAIFRREKEEGVQPVLKDDVAEVLRRRFFTAKSIENRDSFRGHVVAALRGIADLDDQTRKEGKAAEERYLNSYPFHPDLIDVFYAKWTQLEGFQRTRGVLRTFALALRESEKWDDAPLVATGAFLTHPTKSGISEAARELTTVAATEEYEGKKQEWTGILEGELGKARDIQSENTALKFRELEQAVFATFLHS